MKEFNLFFSLAIAATIMLSYSCNDLRISYSPKAEESGGCICLGFREPVASTRAAEYDTNSFILSVVSTMGDTVYFGRYSGRPATMTVMAGTYEIDVVSRKMTLPEFEAPQYGDRQVVVVSNGQRVNVSLLCKRVNAGIKLIFAESFKEKYVTGNLLLGQSSGSIIYSLEETRTAYFSPGNVYFVTKSDESCDTLFVKNVAPGEVYNLTLNASSDRSQAGFGIAVDDFADTLSQDLVIGDRYSGADGLSSASALDIASAADFDGDSVWIWGYIVGGDMTTTSIKFEGPFEKSSHIALAESPNERVRSKCFPVELSRKLVKEALNLVDNPGNLGRKVFLKGVVSSYFSLSGLKTVTEYVLQ